MKLYAAIKMSKKPLNEKMDGVIKHPDKGHLILTKCDKKDVMIGFIFDYGAEGKILLTDVSDVEQTPRDFAESELFKKMDRKEKLEIYRQQLEKTLSKLADSTVEVPKGVIRNVDWEINWFGSEQRVLDRKLFINDSSIKLNKIFNYQITK